MKVAIASDHRGYGLKQIVIKHLKGAKGVQIDDFGPDTDKERVDYPIYVEKVCKRITDDPECIGIVICGSGLGVSIAANKFNGIRCALCHDAYTAEMSRRHNNANVVAFGSMVIGEGVAISIVDAFLAHEFEGDRHAERVAMLDRIEKHQSAL